MRRNVARGGRLLLAAALAYLTVGIVWETAFDLALTPTGTGDISPWNGPMSFLAYAPVKPAMTAWCIDLRELEDVLALVRQDPVKAQRLLHPFFGQDYIELGLHYLERGRPDVALMDFEKAVKADPNNARAYCCRAMAYRNLGNSSKALADFEEAIQRDPKDSSPFRERAQLYYQQNKFVLE